MMSALRIAFVTHGGPAIGLGHVTRCVALGRAFAAEGAEVRYLISPDERVADLLRCASMIAVEIPWEADPREAFQLLAGLGADVVVVDSYAASPEFLGALRSVSGQVVAVDDMADRPFPVHVVVNGGVGAERLSYRGAPDTVFLLGPRYALVDPGYGAIPSRPVKDPVRRVVLALGGAPDSVALRAAVAAADASLDGVTIDVALGPFAGTASEVEAVRLRAGGRLVMHRGLADLRELMLSADLAIAGAGMTLYELAATATPTIMVAMAENQAPNVDAFERAGAALWGGSAGDSRLELTLESALRRLAGDPALRASLGKRARDLVDGQGASRVAREIASLIPARG